MAPNDLQTGKPHAVCVPYPAQGHLNPMLSLAKLLHHRGFHITYVNTHFNHKRLLKSRGPDALAGLPDFRFESIPDGLPPSDDDSTQDLSSLCDSVRKNCLVPFQQLLCKLNVPPVSCIVSDTCMYFTGKAADELGIPIVYLWPASACSFISSLYIPDLIDKGLTPLKDESYLTNGYLDTVVDWIPGLIKDTRLKDLPSFIRTTDPNDVILNFCLEGINTYKTQSHVILNTFDQLEHQVLEALSPKFPPNFYSIGPLHLFVKEIQDNALHSIGSNLWKEDFECLEWLNTKEPKSVVYVNFGSSTVMSPKQLQEFAWGLADTKKPFVWVIRPDLVKDDSAILPSELLIETKERGIMISWCPQEQVLSHPSIGGFLTHSGWNSTIESLSAGVPMVCWPFFGDQQINCRYSCTEWGIGMEIDSNVTRDEVKKLVRELMEGEKGRKMREKAVEWKIGAQKATGPGGSSLLNFDKMIREDRLLEIRPYSIYLSVVAFFKHNPDRNRFSTI
ncbi:hypothetical protein FNV43_RR22131 [Rhamnella rubrinervis]|uniref:Glycosyltransferase n=1 Tax=Rhamnella rubrinervis TaxID=2594499 RepID=A0A8K0DVK2_9ROSA|nr:hypothetical protein FNV43_RR22131 [Rhamnella rubrinervis]